MNMNRTRGILLSLLLAIGVGACAQVPGGMQMPSLWYNPALMMDPNVQKELGVSPQVANKAVQAMMQEAMKMGPAMMGAMSGKAPTADQMKQATEALARMQSASIKDLNPAQKERFHEITLQSYGTKALLDPKVGAQLNLSKSQSDTLRSGLAKITQAQAAAMKSGSSAPGQFNMANFQSIAAAAKAKSEALLNTVLSPAQKSHWKAMQGKPVKLGPMSSLMGG